MTRVALTYREYAALPDDGRRYEIHDGELSVTAAPGMSHQEVSRRLLVLVLRHVEARNLGKVWYAPVDVILADDTVVQPDIVYVAREHLPAVHERGIEGPPTLAIEILSPSTAAIDRIRKRDLYARHGVPYYWIVDQEARAVETYVLRAGGYELVLRADGVEPVSPPPFEGLALVPELLWA
jgi:Uma2 family endonuclease